MEIIIIIINNKKQEEQISTNRQIPHTLKSLISMLNVFKVKNNVISLR